MSQPKTRGARARGGPLARVLAEAVEAVASPEMRERIFDRALAVAGIDSIPEQGRALLDFVDAYFRAALVSCLGEALADEVITQVEPIVRMAAREESISEVRTIDPPPLEVSGERAIAPAARRGRSSAPTRMPSDRATARAPEDLRAFDVVVPKASKAPTDLPPIELEPLVVDDDDELIDLGTDRPHSEAPEFPDVVELAMTPGPLGAVLFATPLSFLVGPFEKGLGGHTQVTHVADALDILDALDAHPTLSMVVLDCRAHDLDVATIATLLAERDPTPLLVLWGATAAMVDEVALTSDDLRCLAIDESATISELAERCLAAG